MIIKMVICGFFLVFYKYNYKMVDGRWKHFNFPIFLTQCLANFIFKLNVQTRVLFGSNNGKIEGNFVKFLGQITVLLFLLISTKMDQKNKGKIREGILFNSNERKIGDVFGLVIGRFVLLMKEMKLTRFKIYALSLI